MDIRLKDEYVKTEKIDGVIYNMSPSPHFRHGDIMANIMRIVGAGLRGSLCRVYADALDYYYNKESDDYIRPDVMICCDRKDIKNNGYYGTPKFVAEVLSPSTANRDRGIKKDIYEKAGVSEYWIVTPKSDALEIYYLKDGKYVMEHSYMLELEEDMEGYNPKEEISLREFPMIKMELQELFEGWE